MKNRGPFIDLAGNLSEFWTLLLRFCFILLTMRFAGILRFTVLHLQVAHELS